MSIKFRSSEIVGIVVSCRITAYSKHLSEISVRLCLQWELQLQSLTDGLTIAYMISLDEDQVTVCLCDNQALDEYSDEESIRYLFHCLTSWLSCSLTDYNQAIVFMTVSTPRTYSRSASSIPVSKFTSPLLPQKT